MEILLVVLGLGAFGLYNKAILAAVVGITAFDLKQNKKLTTINSMNFIILVLFSITYAIISCIHGLGSLSLIVVPWVSYYLGAIICKEQKSENKIINCILAIAVGFAVHAILNFIYALIVSGGGRNTIDIWTNESTAATVQGTLLVMIESLLCYILMYEKNIKRRIVLIALFVASVLYNIKIGTRTTLLICFIVTVGVIILNLVMSKEKEKKKMLKKIGIIVIIISVVIMLICIIYALDIFNMQEKINDIELVKRFINRQETNNSDSDRIKAIIAALSQTFDHPFGGDKMHIGKIKYAHNLWLDVNRVAGLIPFILIIIYTVLIIKNIIIILKSKEFSKSYKTLVFSIYLGVLINFAVEPILESATYIFIMFCMINGMVDTKLEMIRIEGEKKNENTLDSKYNISISGEGVGNRENSIWGLVKWFGRKLKKPTRS